MARFQCKIPFFLENGAKQIQTGLNRAEWVQTGPNGVKQGQTGSNSAKQGQTAQKWERQVKPGLNWANWGRPEPTRPYNGFHMSLHIMDEKLKLNKEKIKQIYGTKLQFEIHGIGFRVRRLCSYFFSHVRFKRGGLSPYCQTVTTCTNLAKLQI